MTTATRSQSSRLRLVEAPPDDPTTEYALLVQSGDILANKWVRLACKRHLDDLKTGHTRGLRFDLEKATRAISFFGYLRHYKGEWAGTPLKLELWQKFIIGSIFGWVRSNGTRRFRVAYIEVPRKNGKSFLAAGLGLLMAFFEGEQGAEVYAAATKRDQAKLVWGDAKVIVQRSPEIRKRVGIVGLNLNRIDTSSKFEPLGADADTIDGLNVHCAIVDELHAHKKRDMWDVLETATGARSQPLMFAITTAGFNRFSICYEQHDYGIKILEKTFADDSFFCYIATIDEGDDWREESTWRKANPNYGVSVNADDLRSKCEKAQQVPAAQNAFLRLHLNIWTQQETRWLDLDLWEENITAPDAQALIGRKCWAGLDLSSTTDIAALELYFPNEDGEGGDWLHFYYVPEENVKKRAERDRVPYDVWAKQDFLITTPGDVIDYDYIREDLNSLLEDGYEIQEVGYDPWNATSLVTNLQKDGFTCVPIRQGFGSLSAPTKEFERLLLAKKFRIGPNPVTRWAASNVMLDQDAQENVKPSKEKSTERIDPLVAMIMAVDRASRDEGLEQWHGITI